MKHYSWDNEKNILLKETRGICFEHIVMRIEKGDLLDIIKNPSGKYPRQKVFIVNSNSYIYVVPFIPTLNV